MFAMLEFEKGSVRYCVNSFKIILVIAYLIGKWSMCSRDRLLVWELHGRESLSFSEVICFLCVGTVVEPDLQILLYREERAPMPVEFISESSGPVEFISESNNWISPSHICCNTLC